MKKTLVYIFLIIVLISLVFSGCTKEDNIEKEHVDIQLNTEDNESSKVEEKTANMKLKISEFSDLRQVILVMEEKSIKDLDLTGEYDTLLKTTFDTRTEWPSKDKLPKEFNPQEIIEIGKNPGLGIRDLHNQGFTGQGINVAIIDQPLLLGHEEYKDKVVKYTAIECEDVGPQMHGPAVASILVGNDCGVAPSASLYYWAEPSWKGDYVYRVTALDQIIEHNKDKPLNERIRVVSVSKGFSPDEDNLSMWKEKIKEAEKDGIIVVHCSDEGNEGFFGLGCKLYEDRDNPENYDICYFAKNKSFLKSENLLYVPIDNRATADYKGENDYTFWAQGGLSWGAPYLAGVIALGLQVNPNLKEEEIYKYLRETCTPFNGGCIINPKAFIHKVSEID